MDMDMERWASHLVALADRIEHLDQLVGPAQLPPPLPAPEYEIARRFANSNGVGLNGQGPPRPVLMNPEVDVYALEVLQSNFDLVEGSVSISKAQPGVRVVVFKFKAGDSK